MFTVIEATESAIINTNFHYNSAPSTGIFVMIADITFDNCDFKNNTADSKSPNIFSSISSITINNCSFNNDNVPPALSDIQNIEIQGHYLLAHRSIIHLTNSRFFNGYAFRGGAIAAIGCIHIYIYI